MVKVKDMTEKQILDYFKREYIKIGYMYSGSIPINATIFYYNGNNLKRAFNLVKKGKLVLRGVDGSAFELPKKTRAKLITQYNLVEKWQKKAPYFYPDLLYGEVAKVMGMNYAMKYNR